jgi:hypothetical protein
MRFLRSCAAVSFAAITLSAFGQAPMRPDFSGEWWLEADANLMAKEPGRPVARPGSGSRSSSFTFTSNWHGERLVTRVTWTGPRGPREQVETMWRDGEKLIVRSAKPALSPDLDPFVDTHSYIRKR